MVSDILLKLSVAKLMSWYKMVNRSEPRVNNIPGHRNPPNPPIIEQRIGDDL